METFVVLSISCVLERFKHTNFLSSMKIFRYCLQLMKHHSFVKESHHLSVIVPVSSSTSSSCCHYVVT